MKPGLNKSSNPDNVIEALDRNRSKVTKGRIRHEVKQAGAAFASFTSDIFKIQGLP